VAPTVLGFCSRHLTTFLVFSQRVFEAADDGGGRRRAHLVPQALRRALGAQDSAVASDQRRDGGRFLVHQLDAEASDAGPLLQRRYQVRGALGGGVKHGVAAADVGLDGVNQARAIAHADMVALAGAPARAVIAAVRQQR
jgi:hypothetical protein